MKERMFIEKTRGSRIKLLGAAEFRDAQTWKIWEEQIGRKIK